MVKNAKDANKVVDASDLEDLGKLRSHLVDKGIISEEQLETAIRIRDSCSKSKFITKILIDKGFITESVLNQELLESNVELIKDLDLKSTRLDPNAIKMMTKEFALANKVIGVSLVDQEFYVATTDIHDIVLVDQIGRKCGPDYKIMPVYASEADIIESIDRYYGYEMSVDGILKEMVANAENADKLIDNIEEYTNPTVRLVDSIISDASKRGASDIHFEPEETFLRIRYRVDGILLTTCSIDSAYWPSVLVRIKILSNMNIAEKRHPQDGRVSYNHSGRNIDLRVATQPTLHGENVVIRILDRSKSLIPLLDLGFSDSHFACIQRMLMKPEGIIMVAGPTGSGKTTTIYSILNHINSPDINIMTIEDPVEYSIPMIRQSDAKSDGSSSSFSFDEGIKSLMRQDPDVIFIGEVRDNQAATLAIRASVTGHRVFTTIHANDAVGVISRLIDIGIDVKILASALTGAISQRLVRKLCEKCKQPHMPSEKECKILGLESPMEIFGKKGCKDCYNTGYKGREVVYEIFIMNGELAELVASGASVGSIKKFAIEKYDFAPIIDSAIQKVMQGVLDVTELSRVLDASGNLYD